MRVEGEDIRASAQLFFGERERFPGSVRRVAR